jgi:hypothetical protein
MIENESEKLTKEICQSRTHDCDSAGYIVNGLVNNDFVSIGELRSENEGNIILRKTKEKPIFSIEENIPNVKRIKKICDSCKNGEMTVTEISGYNIYDDCGFFHECNKCFNVEVYDESFPLLTDCDVSEIIDNHHDISS